MNIGLQHAARALVDPVDCAGVWTGLCCAAWVLLQVAAAMGPLQRYSAG
jgi:hypothetical protein